ncbi:hypothetical protein [Halorubrum trapanicum]|uniref:hypothetical protein n=1 Tax=Halorubrum trapanicum TaxID=29284 RepID=UPI0012FD372D|nr:hypothetical protein [Halorubrum trapanicum]
MEYNTRRIINEELWRSVVWIAVGLFGWSMILSSTDQLEATAYTALGLPLLTWATLTIFMITLRVTTGMELKVETASGKYLVWFVGLVVGGFLVFWMILVENQSWGISVAYIVGAVLGTLIWRGYIVRAGQ